MNVALIGATGLVGSKILDEALQRGHHVVAIVQQPEKLPKHGQLTAQKADVNDEAHLASLLTGLDAVISAYNAGWTNPDLRSQHLKGVQSIVAAVKRAGVKRLLVVGGAGSLEVSPGVQLVDIPNFPNEWKPGALANRDVLDFLRSENGVTWTMLCPPIQLLPGDRTGRFRIGADEVLRDGNGDSAISLEDYAAAMINELEDPHHPSKRFTVGY